MPVPIVTDGRRIEIGIHGAIVNMVTIVHYDSLRAMPVRIVTGVTLEAH